MVDQLVDRLALSDSVHPNREVIGSSPVYPTKSLTKEPNKNVGNKEWNSYE